MKKLKRLYPFMMGAVTWGGVVKYGTEGPQWALAVFIALFALTGCLFLLEDDED